MARVNVPVTEAALQKATLTTALAGANNDLTFTAIVAGPGGNSIAIVYVVAGASTPLSVAVTGFTITVNVATNAGSAAISTASEVLSAILGNRDAAALLSVALATSNDGTGVVVALASTPLAGGGLGIAQPALVDGDVTNKNLFTANLGDVILECVSSDAGSQTVTFQYAPGAAGGTAPVAGTAETVAAGATRVFGPFSAARFNQNAAGDVYFDPSVSTTLKFRAKRVSKAV